jgi:two-component system, sensor histidine kinase
MKILVVEDCRMNALVITGFLKRHLEDVTIEYAVNGRLGVDLVAKENFDIVLMDINMPVMDGIAATKEIKKSKNPVPVLAVTAVGMDHLEERNALSMFDHILLKPLDYALFTKTLDSVLAHSEDAY